METFLQMGEQKFSRISDPFPQHTHHLSPSYDSLLPLLFHPSSTPGICKRSWLSSGSFKLGVLWIPSPRRTFRRCQGKHLAKVIVMMLSAKLST